MAASLVGCAHTPGDLIYMGMSLPEKELKTYVDRSPAHRAALLLAAVDSELGCPRPGLAVALIEQGTDFATVPSRLTNVPFKRQRGQASWLDQTNTALEHAIAACPAPVLRALKARGAQFDPEAIAQTWTVMGSVVHQPALVLTLDSVKKCPRRVLGIDGPYSADPKAMLSARQVAMRACVAKAGDLRLCHISKPRPLPPGGSGHFDAPSLNQVLLFGHTPSRWPKDGTDSLAGGGCPPVSGLRHHTLVPSDSEAARNPSRLQLLIGGRKGGRFYEKRQVVALPPPVPPADLVLRAQALFEGVPVNKRWLSMVASDMARFEFSGVLGQWAELVAPLIASAAPADRLEEAQRAREGSQTAALLQQGLDVSANWLLTYRDVKAAIAQDDVERLRRGVKTLIERHAVEAKTWPRGKQKLRRFNLMSVLEHALRRQDSSQLQWLMDNGMTDFATETLAMTNNVGHARVLISAGARPNGSHLAQAIYVESPELFALFRAAGAPLQATFAGRAQGANLARLINLAGIAYTLLDILDFKPWRDPDARATLERVLTAEGVPRTPAAQVAQWETLTQDRLGEYDRRQEEERREEKREQELASRRRQARWEAQQEERERTQAAERSRSRRAAEDSQRRREAARSGSGVTVDVAGALERGLYGDRSRAPAPAVATPPPPASAARRCVASQCSSACERSAARCLHAEPGAGPPRSVEREFKAELVTGTTDARHERASAEDLARTDAKNKAYEACGERGGTLDRVEYWYMKCEENRGAKDMKCQIDATPHCQKVEPNPAYVTFQTHARDAARLFDECQQRRTGGVDLCKQECFSRCH